MIGVIPAAGKGTRLGKIGKDIPKSLIKISGITLLERTITHLKKVGVRKIYVIVGHKKEEIIEFINSKNFGLDIKTVVQKEQKGLAHAILQTEKFIKEAFIVHLPDNFLSHNYSFLVEEFNQKDPDFLMMYRKFPQKDAKFYFVIKNNKILDVLNYVDPKKGYEGVGVFITKPLFFNYCKKAMKNLVGGEELNDTHVVSELIRYNKKIMALSYPGKDLNVTTEEDIKKADNLEEF